MLIDTSCPLYARDFDVPDEDDSIEWVEDGEIEGMPAHWYDFDACEIIYPEMCPGKLVYIGDKGTNQYWVQCTECRAAKAFSKRTTRLIKKTQTLYTTKPKAS